ncbi:HD domain-containing protein [Pelagibius sp. Alg239-R121]|uniref:HD domain-containing protein n=1 Tax=Pelagibius sp. Alg239-R121 TaxID=2993448 RepID=UPI0024A739BE|nr:HD domain-containing protein [Pelagibius sp. Alg239-R121]
MDAVEPILDLLKLAEGLKKELRHSWLSDGRRESVAEHSWQMALMAMVMHRHLEHPVDLSRTLQMIVVHDLVEAEAGDVPFFETGERKETKAVREAAAMENIRKLLGGEDGTHIAELWREFEDRETPEAKFAGALDNLEVQLQHNLADFSTWEEIEYGLVYNKMDRPCAHDSFLRAMSSAIKQQAERKMMSGGVDVEAVKARALAPKT